MIVFFVSAAALGQITFSGNRITAATTCDFGHSLIVDPQPVRAGDRVTLTWCNPAFFLTDSGYYVEFYRVYNARSLDGPFMALTDVRGDTTTHIQLQPATGTTYYYVESHGCQGAIVLCNMLPDTTIRTNIVAVNAIGAKDCVPAPGALCVANRFRVIARWQTKSDEASTEGRAVPLTANSGYFWFFDPSNVEVTVKLLDGCAISQSFWFFAAGMTNVKVELTVTDIRENTTKTYTNPLGTAFPTILDTNAFRCP